MEVIYGLIPLMILLGLVMLGLFIWTVRNGQYDDMDGDAQRILMDEDDPNLPANVKSAVTGTGKESAVTKEQDRRKWPDADDE